MRHLTKRKPHVRVACRVGIFSWVQPDTQKALEQIAAIMQREEPKGEWEAGDVGGRMLDTLAPRMVPGLRAVVRTQKRKGRKLTDAEAEAIMKRYLPGAKGTP